MIARRARKYENDMATFRVWPFVTNCQTRAPRQNALAGRCSLVEVKSLLDRTRRYLVVMTLAGGGQVILSRHRKRKPATQALEHFALGR